MGLSKSVIRFLIKENKYKKFMEPVLTLGRQCVYATVDEIKDIMHKEGIEPTEVEKTLSLKTNIPNWEEGLKHNYTSDIVLFRLMGINEIYAMDISTYENPDYIWDLNKPVRTEITERFGVIIDGGTLEHVFDVRQALINIVRMLKPGGRIIHISPATNYMEHAFYQFTPGLFYKFYSSCGFKNIRCFIMEEDIFNPSRKPARFYECELPNFNYVFISSKRVSILFLAEKTSTSAFLDLIYQGVKSISDETREVRLRFQRIKKFIPLPLWKFIRKILYWKYNKKERVYKHIGKI